jgi:hypothetical protein
MHFSILAKRPFKQSGVGGEQRAVASCRLVGLYYQNLEIYALTKMDTFCSKLVSFLLSVINTLVWANALACFRIRSHVFIVQAP